MATRPKFGLLLTNLGSPQSLTVKDIQAFLDVFLMDERVVDYPYWFRYLLMHCFVVPRRAPKALEAYKRIWTDEGSPLLVEANKLLKRVQGKADFPVALSMRYKAPTTEKAFDALLTQEPDLEEVFVLPLYPQYTMSSFDTAVEEVLRVHKKGNYPFKLTIMDPFYNDPDYIAALGESIRPYLEQDFDKLLFSYHGIPERHLRKDRKRLKTDTNAPFELPKVDYQSQAKETSRLVAEYLGLSSEKYECSFQSRLESAGREWIKPYTANRLEALPSEGCRKLLVVCPAFINDCLETIEEIGMDGRDRFEAAGGEELILIPCLNDQAQFADSIVQWVRESRK